MCPRLVWTPPFGGLIATDKEIRRKPGLHYQTIICVIQQKAPTIQSSDRAIGALSESRLSFTAFRLCVWLAGG